MSVPLVLYIYLNTDLSFYNLQALQVVMQPVLESLLIVDRYSFLLEHGLDVHLIPVFNDFVSPRNMAIVAFKEI